MKKIIYKVIDQYFENKFVDFIYDQALYYNLDFKVEINKNTIVLKVKKREYKESLYKNVCVFTRKNIFNYLMHQNYLQDHIHKLIDYYILVM